MKKKRPGPGRPPTKKPPRKYKRGCLWDYNKLHSESSPERTKYERWMKRYLNSRSITKPITVDYIEKAIKWTGSQPNVSLHPIVSSTFKSSRLACVVSWLLWVEASCTDLTINASGWGEWFCAKYADCETLTGVSRLKMNSIIKKLRMLGIISTQRRGIPAMQHFRIDHSALYTIIMESILSREVTIPDALDASEWSRSVYQ